MSQNQSKTLEQDITWTETIIPDNFPAPCKHYFEFMDGLCKCRQCGLGLFGVLEVKNGKPVM